MSCVNRYQPSSASLENISASLVPRGRISLTWVTSRPRALRAVAILGLRFSSRRRVNVSVDQAAASRDSNSTAALTCFSLSKYAAAADFGEEAFAIPATTSVRKAVPSTTGAPKAIFGSNTTGKALESGHQRCASEVSLLKEISSRNGLSKIAD